MENKLVAETDFCGVGSGAQAPTLCEEHGVNLEAPSVPQPQGQQVEVEALQVEADLQGLPGALHLVRDGHVWGRGRTRSITTPSGEKSGKLLQYRQASLGPRDVYNFLFTCGCHLILGVKGG